MGKNFFQDWRGDFPNPFAKNQWAKAEGSSLKREEKKALASGGIATHDKTCGAVKVFAKDSEGTLWSIIVPTAQLPAIKKSLAEAGFVAK